MKSFRKHQYTMFAYTMRVKHLALFVEMRLGKCLVMIRRAKLYIPRNRTAGLKVLVVAPSSALGSWESELESEGESFVTLDGPLQQKKDKLNTDVRWYLANKECHQYMPVELALKEWDLVILDESTFIKNPKAGVTKYYCRRFRTVPHRACLTGTPNPENDLEFFCQFLFLEGRAFGFSNWYQFRAVKYHAPAFTGEAWLPKYGTQTLMRTEIARRALIMRRTDVGMEPEKVQVERGIEMPEALRQRYDRIESDFELPDGETTIWATTTYGWLRQLCGGFIKKKMVWPAKMDELVHLLTTELKGAPVIVFFNYNHEIEFAVDYLYQKGVMSDYINGDQPRPKREEIRKSWMAGNFDVLLVQQAVAQMGMDLSRADTVIYYSEPPGNLAALQTADRVVSLSKTAKLLYIFLIVKNSVDADVRNALKNKKFNSNLTLSHALKIALMERRNGH